jgi:hypothetical protein
LEKMRATRTASERTTVLLGSVFEGWDAARFLKFGRWCPYHPPTLERSTMPPIASTLNQMMDDWPFGAMMSAARSGPREEPRLPPVWNTDWARPYRSPAAMCATRDASGWKIEEPMPTMTDETRIIG